MEISNNRKTFSGIVRFPGKAASGVFLTFECTFLHTSYSEISRYIDDIQGASEKNTVLECRKIRSKIRET